VVREPSVLDNIEAEEVDLALSEERLGLQVAHDEQGHAVVEDDNHHGSLLVDDDLRLPVTQCRAVCPRYRLSLEFRFFIIITLQENPLKYCSVCVTGVYSFCEMISNHYQVLKEITNGFYEKIF